MEDLHFSKEIETKVKEWFVDINKILDKDEFKNLPPYTNEELDEILENVLNYSFVNEKETK